jgi:hypothetical protein
MTLPAIAGAIWITGLRYRGQWPTRNKTADDLIHRPTLVTTIRQNKFVRRFESPMSCKGSRSLLCVGLGMRRLIRRTSNPRPSTLSHCQNRATASS